MRDRKDEQKMKKNVTLIGMPGSGKSAGVSFRGFGSGDPGTDRKASA